MGQSIIVITGNSGAGKDTLAGLIGEQLCLRGSRSQVVKFVAPFKQAMATYLQVDVEMMEDREFRTTVIPELGCSPLELMIRGYHVMPQLHPELGLYTSRKVVERIMAKSILPIFTDMRNEVEARYLLESVYAGNRLTLISLTRNGAEALSSDVSQPKLVQMLAPVATTFTCYHNTTLEALGIFAQQIVKDLSYNEDTVEVS